MKQLDISVSFELNAPLDNTVRNSARFRIFGRARAHRMYLTVTESRAQSVLRWLDEHASEIGIERLERFNAQLGRSEWGAVGATDYGVLHPYTRLATTGAPEAPLELEWVPTDEPVCLADGKHVIENTLGTLLRDSNDTLERIRIDGDLSANWHLWQPGGRCRLLDERCVDDKGRWLGIWVARPDQRGPRGSALDELEYVDVVGKDASANPRVNPLVLGPDVVDKVRQTPAAVAPVFGAESWPARFALDIMDRRGDFAPAN